MSQDLVQLARNVEKARADLDRAIEALRAATGLSSSPRSRSGTAAPRGATASRSGSAANSDSVAARVLAAITSSPTGAARAELSGLGSAGAIHSALKQHKARGSITNRDGRWFAASSGTGSAGRTKKKGPEAQ